MKKKINLSLLIIFFFLFFINYSQANFQEQLINKYKTINTLSFDFTQTVGDKVEFGNCYIKYPLLMKCEYPKKNKSIIANGNKFAIVKKRYKKIYYYSLKKTPLFYLLNKENILDVIQNNEPLLMNSDLIEYELTDNNLNKINIFFDRNSYNLIGWQTEDIYQNLVITFIYNIKKNSKIDDKLFKLPKQH